MSGSAKDTLDAGQPPADAETETSAGRASLLSVILRALGKVGQAIKAVVLFLLPRQETVLPALSARTMSILALIIAVTGFAATQIELPGNDSNARIEAMERSLRTLETRLTIPGAGELNSPGHASQLLAIQFVTNAAERSTPFDTALAVAIRMTGNHEEIGPLLDELLIEAPNGVPSRDDLRIDFKGRLAKFQEDGVVGSITEPAADSSFGLSGFLGLGGSAVSEEDTAILQKLSAYVADDKFHEAILLVGKLDGKLRDGLESWREKAMRRAALDETLAELRRIAFLGIIGNG